MYTKVENAKLSGTSAQVEVSASPSQLVTLFGKPSEEKWDSESLGAYYFLGENDLPFSVYYRAHDQSQNELKKLRLSFWRQEEEVEFSIGALNEEQALNFKAWLQGQLAE